MGNKVNLLMKSGAEAGGVEGIRGGGRVRRGNQGRRQGALRESGAEAGGVKGIRDGGRGRRGNQRRMQGASKESVAYAGGVEGIMVEAGRGYNLTIAFSTCLETLFHVLFVCV